MQVRGTHAWKWETLCSKANTKSHGRNLIFYNNSQVEPLFDTTAQLCYTSRCGVCERTAEYALRFRNLWANHTQDVFRIKWLPSEGPLMLPHASITHKLGRWHEMLRVGRQYGQRHLPPWPAQRDACTPAQVTGTSAPWWMLQWLQQPEQ